MDYRDVLGVGSQGLEDEVVQNCSCSPRGLGGDDTLPGEGELLEVVHVERKREVYLPRE